MNTKELFEGIEGIVDSINPMTETNIFSDAFDFLEKAKNEYRPIGKWGNGRFLIEWINQDEVQVYDQKLNKSIKMDGGDFEYILQGLLAVKKNN